ncbi:MAG TPA: GTP cyclohydrolase II [Rhodobacteraceae bacterium]|jgi:GTP cyclohydrolase II|nr:GTP cyclohydrolase II [Paracoccaceae bacterium]HBG98416.1 GTP cyclohydrolase II [Paracoccaceae bacterium]
MQNGLAPSPSEIVARARADLRLGLPVLLAGAGAATLAAAVETLSEARFAALPRPLILALTARRAQTLKIAPYDGDLVRVAVPDEADLAWVRAVADPADDLDTPLMGPFHALRGGDAGPARVALALAKQAALLPAALLTDIADGAGFAARHGLTRLTLPLPLPADDARAIAAARLPMALAGMGRLHVFRDLAGTAEHYAVEIGTPPRRDPVLTRLHSACFTGDVLGSLKCDCGPQLHAALAAMGAEGAGLLLYLNQEGRGIGLANKMRAYALQDQGFDTVEANHRLGFEDDERDFRIGAAILAAMGFSAVRLMTNNPAKVDKMAAHGITVVERVPLKVGRSAMNADYLDTKATKSGHLL